MTQSRKTVEPPLASRCVQTTIALVLGCSLLTLTLRLGVEGGRSPPPAGPTRPIAVDLNAAGPSELALLPGIGPVLADRIKADRERHGPFATFDDLTRVPGVGEKTVERLRRYVTPEAPGP